MIHLLYSIAGYVGAAAMSPAILAWLAGSAKQRAGFFQKLGLGLPRQDARTIWFHAVSVGEALAAVELVKAVAAAAPEFPLVVTTTTPTGQKVAREKLSALATVCYFPYDLWNSAHGAVRALNPALLVLVDTELWPNVIHEVVREGGRVAMVNARVSDRSFPRYRALSWFWRPVLDDVAVFIPQSRMDGERLVAIGADPARVDPPGALKFDRAAPEPAAERKRLLRASLGIGPDAPVIFLGSIHDGEQEAIRAALMARDKIRGARIVIAPRRVEDTGWIERALEGSGLRALLKTRMSGADTGADIVPVVDTFGELFDLYGAADAAFVGGSLIAHGGQNPLEPAANGVPCLLGPHMNNFRDAVELLTRAGGAQTVHSAEELAAGFIRILADGGARAAMGAAARQAVLDNRGATARAAERIVRLARGR